MCQVEKPEEVKNKEADPPLVTGPIVPVQRWEVARMSCMQSPHPPPPFFAHP